jgi:hypothetical protein
MSKPGSASCPHCGERIGRYEPVIVLESDGPRLTSIAREPDIERADFELLHEYCFAGRERALK